MAGRSIDDDEIARRWQAWTPTDVSQRLAGVTAPWCVTAGWALNLFTDAAARNHDDIEIAVPANRFSDIMAALPAFEWDVVGDGQVWPFPEEHKNHFQTWLREPDTGIYHLDVFHEPTTGNQWVCRRDARITLPYNELILHTDDGIPYVIPEVALLFKAKHLRHKDQLDFTNVVPALGQARRDRLASWLSQVHPGHPWINRLATRFQ
jgi:hypothetical protein